jgi:hypothetical protein
MDGAYLGSGDIALHKAQTSARFPFPTRGVQELAYGKDLKGGMVPGLALVPGIVALGRPKQRVDAWPRRDASMCEEIRQRMYVRHMLPVRDTMLLQMITPGVEQMYETCLSVAKASSPLFRTDRVGLAEVRSARLPSLQSQRLDLASAVCPLAATSIVE